MKNKRKKEKKKKTTASVRLSKSYEHGGKPNEQINKPKTLQQLKEPNKTKQKQNSQTPHHELELVRTGLYLASHALC